MLVLSTVGKLAVVLFAVQFAASSQEKEEPPAAPAGPATYVGSETCQGCHDEIFARLQKNRHVLVETAPKFEKWNKQACEACHGPGSRHAETLDPGDIIQPAKLPGGQEWS